MNRVLLSEGGNQTPFGDQKSVGRDAKGHVVVEASPASSFIVIEATMTEDRLPLNELLQKAGDGDFLRAVAESVLQLLMEADVEGLIGAGRHERASDRLNWRNGYRDRTLDTRLGSLNLQIPKLRGRGRFSP